MAGRPQCKHVKPDGSSCGATATPSGFCWFHDPAIAEQRDAARKRGGQQTRQRRRKIVVPHDTADLPLTNPDEVAAALACTFNEVRRGEMDVRTANCLALIGGTILRAFRGENEKEISVIVQQPREEPLLLTDEMKQSLIDKIKQRRESREMIGRKELPPSPAASTWPDGAG